MNAQGVADAVLVDPATFGQMLAGWLSVEWGVADRVDGAQLAADALRGIARVLEGVQQVPADRPRLGLATTGELLAELVARAEVNGYAGYRTVDDEVDGGQVVEL